eukprot:scaffold67728_cov28-Tisochrysis_lutea.AAC.6
MPESHNQARQGLLPAWPPARQRQPIAGHTRLRLPEQLVCEHHRLARQVVPPSSTWCQRGEAATPMQARKAPTGAPGLS